MTTLSTSWRIWTPFLTVIWKFLCFENTHVCKTKPRDRFDYLLAHVGLLPVFQTIFFFEGQNDLWFTVALESR